MSEYKMLSLDQVRPDPNQPRKFFDEAAMKELTDSIAEKGVIQPILVRPYGKGYRIVCGERRYRASLAANKNVIPAIVKELSDAETLDLQIIENLQRKDVNPMEEALAFKMMLDSGKSAEEIGIKVGKNPFFVRQRLTLAKLTDNWQLVVFHGNISLKQAMQISRLTPANQEKLYENEVELSKVGNPNYSPNITNYDLQLYTGSLSEAPFDLNDKNLNPERGACTTCPFNSNYAVLFPEGESGRCNDIECYNQKCNRSFELRLAAFQDEPGAVFISTVYSPDKDELKALGKQGIDVVGYNGYKSLHAPTEPDRQEWVEDYGDYHDTPDALEAAWQDVLKEYQDEVAGYETNIASGKYKKALVVIGDEKGSFRYIKLNKNTQVVKADAVATESAAGVTVQDIDDEISRVNEKEKCAKQLDAQKLWADVYPHFRPEPNLQMLKGAELGPTERVAIARTLHNDLPYGRREDFEKHFKIKDIDKVSEISFSQLNEMLRFFFLEKLPPAPTTLYRGHNEDSLFCMKLGKEYFPSVVSDIEATHADRVQKRVSKVTARIAELKKQKKELTSVKKSSKK